MSDQCKTCSMRGDLPGCEKTDCCHHENWYAMELKSKLAAAEQRAEQAEEKLKELGALIDKQGGTIWTLLNEKEQAERKAVRECERIATPRDRHVGRVIRNRWPQHFREVE